MSDYERQTRELVPVLLNKGTKRRPIYVGPDEVASVQVSVTAYEATVAGEWVPASVAGDQIGPMTGPGTPNDFSGLDESQFPLAKRVWARYTPPAGPELPVIDCGSYTTS